MGDSIVWWITLQVLGLIAFPIANTALRGLPDRGYGVSKVLGLLLTGWLAYTIAMMQLAQFGRGLLIACAVAVAAFSLWLLMRNERAALDELRDYIRRPGVLRYIVVAELLFTVAFAVWAFYRAHDPDIYGLEKFMDFGFYNSITISGSFPPNDMWLAGHSINYYYFGYVLMASLGMLAGIPTEIGYNLANVTLFALTALGAFSIVFNMVVAARGRQRGPAAAVAVRAETAHPTARRAERQVPARPAQVGQRALPTRRSVQRTAVADRRPRAEADREPGVAVLEQSGEPNEISTHAANGRSNGRENSKEAEPLLSSDERVPIGLAYEASDTRYPRDEIARAGISPLLAGLLAAIMIVAMGNLSVPFATKADPRSDPLVGNGFVFCWLCLDSQHFNWWSPSRVIQDYKSVEVPGQPPVKQKVGNETINEFPAFSFLINDLHPHVMALPFVLLAVSAALALSRRRIFRGTRWLDGLPRGVGGWLAVFLAGLVAGTLYTANTWDYPTYLLLIILGVAVPLLAHQRSSSTPWGWRWVQPFLVQAALIVGISLLSFVLFHLTFKSLVGGQPAALDPGIKGIPIIGGILERLSGFVLVNTSDKTILGFLVVFGTQIVALLVWIGYEVARNVRRHDLERDGKVAHWSLLAVTLGALFFAWVLRFPLLALLLPMAYAALYIIWREPAVSIRSMALGMVALGALIALAIEVVFLKDVFNDRMNTLFKFYYQLWIIWGVTAAYGLWRVLSATFARRRADTERGTTSPVIMVARVGASAWAAVFLFMVGAASMYILAAMPSKVGATPTLWGLDGTTHLTRSAPTDYDAIQWLKANATSRDVVLECCRDEYNIRGHAGRVSSYTGIPTLLAWDGHENQWRGGQPELLAEVGERRSLVNAIYTGNSPADTAAGLRETLQDYGVTYVFVGTTERGQGALPEESITPKAEALFREVLSPVFQSGTTIIYRVPNTGASGIR